MTKDTYNELFLLRKSLLEKIEAINVLIGNYEKKQEIPPEPASIRRPAKPRKEKSNPKFPWSKQDAIDFIINTIKVHNNVPLSVEEIIDLSPFKESQRYEAQARISAALLAMHNGNVLEKRKKQSSSGKYCYHYKFP